MKIPFTFFLAFSMGISLMAQEADSVGTSERIFQLGEVRVVGLPIDSLGLVSAKKMEKFNQTDISHAMNMLPGITLGNVGPRNESVVYIRGFDLRQVPVFMDGVPVYVPYDGYVDMARFTTADLSQISVSKGFTSVLYGANTMGGAINLVSRKPAKKLEINARAGIFSGQAYRWNINAGSRLADFYYQIGVSQLSQNFFPLSGDFEATEFENGHGRENSFRNDFKISFKAGFTPNETDEYVVGYTFQKGEKGNPPYVGEDVNIRTRFWQWPKWNKQSLFLVSNTVLNSKNVIKGRVYYDTFVNELYSYDDASYSSMTRPYAFQSYYDDYTIGGNVELISRTWDKNVLKFGAQLKRDIHRENSLDEPQRNFIDHTLSVGLENTYSINSGLAVVPGLSFNQRSSLLAEDYNTTTQEIIDFPSNSNHAVNAQVGLFWDISPTSELQGSISRKTRFATIKDRYSYRMGQAIPNPDLGAEVALNYDLSYRGKFWDKLTVNSSLFRSDISAIIQRVDNVEPGQFQLQNAGDALFYGGELSLDYRLSPGLVFGSNYSYIKRRNLTNSEILFTNVPDHKVFGYIDCSFLSRINVLFSTEYNSKRYSTSYGTQAGEYMLLNMKAAIKLIDQLQVEGGANNLLDKNYELVEGFPEAGRNYFLNLSYTY